MKVRLYPALATAASALMLMGAAASSEAEGPDTFRVVAVAPGHALGLRSGPGVLYPVAGALPANATGVRNLGCKGGLSYPEWARATARERAASIERRWCRVRFGAVTGWARGKFLREDLPGR